MKKIAILDQEWNRVMVAEVPDYLADCGRSDEVIAEAIFSALGISFGNSDYMMGEFSFSVDTAVLNEGPYNFSGDKVRRLDEFTGNFKEEVMAALEEIED